MFITVSPPHTGALMDATFGQASEARTDGVSNLDWLQKSPTKFCLLNSWIKTPKEVLRSQEIKEKYTTNAARRGNRCSWLRPATANCMSCTST